MNNNINPLLKETFIFRPLADHENMLRYAEGEWIPDDGQPDMAFIYYDTAPMVEYVYMPYYTNILWSWWEVGEHGRLWHYCTTNNQDWTFYRFDRRYSHPNELAGKSGMNKCCDLYHCANGQSISITSDNDYTRLNKLIIQSTGEVVTKPANVICFLCLNDGYGHRLQELQSKKVQLEENKEDAERQINNSESDLYDAKADLERTNKALVELEQALAKTEGKEERC